VRVNKLYHCSYTLSYHFVFVTKYRRKCLSAAMLDRLREVVLKLCADWQAELFEINGEADHLHLLLGLNPKCAPSTVANNFKTVTSRLLRKEFAALRAAYREATLWSRSYFVATVGGAPLSVIKQYIEQQARPT
jgi:putative transposase